MHNIIHSDNLSINFKNEVIFNNIIFLKNLIISKPKIIFDKKKNQIRTFF